jgi:cytochrome c oxidase accessory protein FixG
MKSIEELLASKNIIPERPPSLDSKGHRLDIFPAKVQGKFRKYRDVVYTFLLFIFLVIPWTTFSGQQTILLDLWNKKFVFFGLTLLAHDGPIIFLFLGIVVFGLFYATAIYGRVWCGWACPQTVFIDGLFRRIEEWIEGNHIKRKKLSESKLTKEKFFKKTLKWTVFILVSSHIAHSIVAYFIGAKDLFWITLIPSSENLTLFVFLQIFTALIAVNFGWFKEQFCLVACPYGRFQSVVMDANSKTVIYDYGRGEPRRETKDKAYADCVNCFKCVAVCPTGIDIRDGQQLECIGCTACIDACDVVMEKLNKPKGLIRYASEREIAEGANYKSKLNLRVWMYGAGLAFFIIALTLFILFRDDLSVKVLRATAAPYTVTQSAKGGLISNHFKIHVTNQTEKVMDIKSFRVDLSNVVVVSPLLPLKLGAKEQEWVHVFLLVPKKVFTDSILPARWTLLFDKTNVKKGELSILGPSK